MKVIVTGANGFIGSHMCNFLTKNNIEVVGISRSFFPTLREKLKNVKLVECDILSDEFLNKKIEADVIIHLASANDILSKQTLKGIELSSIGTKNCLEFAKSNKINKFIFFSTLQVYGSELNGNYNEENKLAPDNDYAVNHMFGEIYTELYSRKHNINVMILRPSNVYGSFLTKEIERWSLVPGCFCKEIKENQTLTLLSSGNQYRNFISLEQVSYITLKVLKNMKKRFDILNLVTNNYQTIRDVAILVSEVAYEKFQVKINPKIMSDLPKIGNEFNFNNDKLSNYDINSGDLDSISNLQDEIFKLFQTLDLKS